MDCDRARFCPVRMEFFQTRLPKQPVSIRAILAALDHQEDLQWAGQRPTHSCYGLPKDCCVGPIGHDLPRGRSVR